MRLAKIILMVVLAMGVGVVSVGAAKSRTEGLVSKTDVSRLTVKFTQLNKQKTAQMTKNIKRMRSAVERRKSKIEPGAYDAAIVALDAAQSAVDSQKGRQYGVSTETTDAKAELNTVLASLNSDLKTIYTNYMVPARAAVKLAIGEKETPAEVK